MADSAYPQDAPGRRRVLSRWWYAAGASAALLGIVGALVIGRGAVGVARDAEVTPLPADGRVEVTERRFAVWVAADVPGDVTGAELGVRCTLRPYGVPEDAGIGVEVPALRNQSAVVGRWHLVAMSAVDSTDDYVGAAGTLACSSSDPRLVAATWGTGNQPQVLGVIGLAVAALVVGTGGLALGALLTFVVWLVRRRALRRAP